MQPEEYLTSRVDDQINWYSAKSRRNKKWYYVCQVVVLISGALIPLLTGYVDKADVFKYSTGALGVIVVIFQGLQSLKKYKDNWLTYRATAELLTHEKLLYLNAVEPYSDEKTAFKLFVKNAEGIMASENQSWKGLRENEQEQN